MLETERMKKNTLPGILVAVLLSAVSLSAAPIKTLIVDGQSNGSHNMAAGSGEIKKILEGAGLFTVETATSPAKGQDMSGFKPNFSAYDLVVFNYDGDPWPTETQAAFVKFMQDGGGMVVVHSADNAFGNWKEFNEMIGVGGWGGRNEKSGPYLRLRDGKWVALDEPGRGGSHGKARPYAVTTREPKHPVMQGLPAEWLHVSDELYDRLRGPAKNVSVLASAMTDPKTGGSGEEEPVLMAIAYGRGRVFHTTMGHGLPQMKCVGFIVTVQRGAEWAATGKVTQKIPADFPTAAETKTRP
jgi:type 1 glutamine amidotransferase